MNADQLLRLYDRVCEAEDAVPRLRRLVLDLAVRGKLVPQDPEDEPAAELLKRIEKEKARLVKAGEIRKPKSIESPDDAPFNLPANWAWSNIASLGSVSPRNEAEDDAMASFVPMTLIPTEIRAANGHEPRHWREIKKGYTHFAEGDVGLAKITPCFENGKSAVFRGLTGGFGAGTTELHIVRPIFVSPDYILTYLKSPQFIENGIPRMTGTAGQKRVPTEYFIGTPFPLPPLAEQHRIVAKVEELMALLDRIEAARAGREETRNRLTAATLARLTDPKADAPAATRFALDTLAPLTTRPDQIKTLRQTILNLAVRGRLVPQDPADEPASELLKRVSVERARLEKAGAIRSTKRAASLEGTKLRFNPPPRWRWTNLECLFAITGGIQKTPGRMPKANAFPYLGVGNVYRNRIDLTNLKKFELQDGEVDKFGLQPFDILVVEGNGSATEIGRCAMWEGQIEQCVHQNHLIRCRPIDPNLSRYALLYLNSPLGMDEMTELAITSAGLYNLSVGKISTVPLPLPPLAEQHRIVAKVDALMRLLDDLEAALSASSTTRARLLDATLRAALAEPGHTRAAA